MSIYYNVNALAERLCVNLESSQYPLNNDIFSSQLSVKERRKTIRRNIWEKLLQRGPRQRQSSGMKDFSADDRNSGVDVFLEAYMNGVMPHFEFSKCLEIAESLENKNDTVHLTINFLLLLRKLHCKFETDTLSGCSNWRFGNSTLKEKLCLPLKNLHPKIDWNAAIHFPTGTYYRSWESSSFESKSTSRSELEADYDYWHRSRVLMGNACFDASTPTSLLETFRDVDLVEFRKACTYLLIGCSSDIFICDSASNQYCLRPNIYISGISHDSLNSFAKKLFPIAHSFQSIRAFLSSVFATSDSLPFVAKWYCLAVKQLMHRYLEKVVSASNKDFSSNEGGFVQLSRDYDEMLQNTVDIFQLWRTSQIVQCLPQNNANPWCLIGCLFDRGLSSSWQADTAQLDQSLILEQFIFAEVTNPFLKRLSFAVFSGLSSCRPSLEQFGISIQHDKLSQRDVSYWLEGFVIRKETIDEFAAHFIPLMDDLLSAARCVDFLKICKPSHYLISLINSISNSLPLLEFIPANDYDFRESYLAKHEFFRQDASEVRLSTQRYFEEIRQMTVRAVLDQVELLTRQLKQRDEAIKARKLEQEKKKQEQKRELRDQQLAETAARLAAKATAREKEREADREMVQRLAQEDFLRTELERRLAEEERRRLIEHYAELERQAEWRRAKAQWRTQRLQLTEQRLAFLDMAKELPKPIFDDSELKAERAPPVNQVPVIIEPAEAEQQVPPTVTNPPQNETTEPSVETEQELPIVEENVAIINNQNEENLLPLQVGEQFPNLADEPIMPIVDRTHRKDSEQSENNNEEFVNGRELLEELRKSAEPEAEIEEKEVESTNSEPVISPTEEYLERDIQSAVEPSPEESQIKLFVPEQLAPLQVFDQNPTSSLSNFLVKRSNIAAKVDKNKRRVVTFTELFEICLLQPARAISELVNFAVVEYLRNQLDIVGHLSALRHYLLMDAGEFAIAVSLPIFQALNSTKKPEYGIGKDHITHFFLETTLGNAVRYASSPISVLLAEERSRSGYDDVFSLQQDFTKKLKFLPYHGELDPLKPFCFDVLELTYQVGWPLNIILPQEDIAIYSRVFSFLLEIYRVVNMLDSCLQILEDCQQVANRQAQIVDQSITLVALRRAHHARSLMRFFFTSIQTYLSSHVLRPQWEKLLREVDNAKSLDDIRKAHMTYLNNLKNRCFLTESTKPFRGILGRLIRCVLEFNSELNAIALNVVSGSGPVKKAQVAKIQAASNDFRANSAHFVAVAAQRVSQFDRLGFLDRLLLQLTFNDFYTCGDTNLDLTVVPA